ncbi:MAG TPA: hypothetical protein VIL35_05880 [Vicinamibacterales bacterium]
MSARPGRTGSCRARWRAFRWPLLVAAVAAFAIWNLVFDLWLGQAERQYLWNQARHALGEAPAVSLQGSMESAIGSGLVVASAWAVFVLVAVLAAAGLAWRAARQGDAAPHAAGARRENQRASRASSGT